MINQPSSPGWGGDRPTTTKLIIAVVMAVGVGAVAVTLWFTDHGRLGMVLGILDLMAVIIVVQELDVRRRQYYLLREELDETT